MTQYDIVSFPAVCVSTVTQCHFLQHVSIHVVNSILSDSVNTTNSHTLYISIYRSIHKSPYQSTSAMDTNGQILSVQLAKINLCTNLHVTFFTGILINFFFTC